MILTKEQIEKRVSSEDNIVNKLESHKNDSNTEIIYKDKNTDGKNNFGRAGLSGAGSKNLTEEERIAIGVLAQTVGSQTAADLMVVSQRTAAHLSSGQTTITPYGEGSQKFAINNELREKIAERLNTTKMTIQERAAEKLLRTMGLITDDKLENCSVKDLASITKEMSSVMRNMNPSSEKNGNGPNIRIVVQQPKTVREEAFDVLEIGVS